MKISRRFTTVLGAAAVMALPALAGAQSVLFKGTTQACLNSSTIFAGCAQTEGGGAVTFVNGMFNNTTVNGVAGFNGLANNFGSLLTGAGTYGPINQPFALQINFTNPNIPAGQNQLFTANITGSIASTQGGFVLHYDNPDLFFNFTQGSTAGIAHLKLSQDIGFDGLNVGLLNGSVSVTATPEPSSMALLGTGIIGLVPMIRRKKQA